MKILLVVIIMLFGIPSVNTFSSDYKRKKIERERQEKEVRKIKKEKRERSDFIINTLKLTDRQKGQIKSVNKYFTAQEDSLKLNLTLLKEDREKKELQLKIEHRTSFFALLNSEQREKASTIFKNSDIYVDEKLLARITKERATMFATKPKIEEKVSKETKKHLAELRDEYVRLKLILDLRNLDSFEKEQAIIDLKENFKEDKERIIAMEGKFHKEDLHVYQLDYAYEYESEFDDFTN